LAAILLGPIRPRNTVDL